MSYFGGRVRIAKSEKVDFIVPERLRSARISRAMSFDEAAEKLGLSKRELGKLENGHGEIPIELLFKLMKIYNFPRGYFYIVRWERV